MIGESPTATSPRNNFVTEAKKVALKKEYEMFLTRKSAGYLVKRTSELLSRNLNDSIEHLDLTRSHWVILACLWRQDGLPVTYIGKQVQQVGGTVTAVLDRMEKRKLVRRKRDPADRRVWRVWLTEAGAEMGTILPPIVQKIWQKALGDTDASEIARFSDVLDLAIKNCNPDYTCCLPECETSVAPKYRKLLPPKSLGYRLKLLSLLLGRMFAEQAQAYNVTSTHWNILCRLWQSDGISTSEIGQYIEQVGGTLAGVLERMEERGIIRRVQDDIDRRCVRAWLTPDGEALIEVLPPIARHCLDTAFAGVAPDDVESFRTFLERVIVNLQREEK